MSMRHFPRRKDGEEWAMDIERPIAVEIVGGGQNARLSDAVTYAASNAGTGNAVTDLIFSMAKRDVTFFRATAPMSFL